jgi:hypothetical protein
LGYFIQRPQLADRAAKIVGALSQFIKQPCVLDGDDGLISKSLYHVNLPLRERLDPLAREVQHPDRLPLAHQRDAKHRPYLCDRDRLRDLVFLVVSKVGNLQRPALDNHASSHSFPSCGEGVMVKKGLLQPFQSTKAEALEG